MNNIKTFYRTTSYDFPVTNHKQSASLENIGWIRGILEEGVPFEAEIWQTENEKGLGVILPVVGMSTLNEEGELADYNTKANVMNFHEKCVSYDGGILPIGMV